MPTYRIARSAGTQSLEECPVSADEHAPEWNLLSDRLEQVPLVAAARRILRVLAALEPGEAPTALVAAHAGMTSAAARRHLQHLARIGLAQADATGLDSYRTGASPLVLRPMTLTAAGTARAVTWYLTCAFEAARVLGAAALPDAEHIPRDPDRPPLVPVDRAAALAWFARSRPVLAGALESACDLGSEASAWRLGLLMLNIGCFAGVWEDWRKVYELSVNAARADRAPRALAQLEEFAGKLELTSGNPAAARMHHQRSLAIRAAEGEKGATARSLNALGVSFLREGTLPEARALFVHALELALEAEDPEFAAFARMNIAAVDARTGCATAAIEQLRSVSRELRDVGREVYVANAIEDAAAAHYAQGDLPKALATAREAEAVAVATGLPMFLAGPLIEQARVHADRGRTRIALALLHEAHAIYEELGDHLRTERTHLRIEQLSQLPAEPAARPFAHAAAEHGGEHDTQD